MFADGEKAGPKLDTRWANAPFGVVEDALDISWETEEVFDGYDGRSTPAATSEYDDDSASKCNRASFLRRMATSSLLP